MFDIGESVCYPMHGVGIIETIEEKDVLGQKASYYTLRFFGGKMTAMVPVHSSDAVGLRKIISKDVYKRVFDYLTAEPLGESDNWNQRYRDNLDKLKSGDIFEVADVVKCLVRRDNLRGLSTGERKMLVTAKNVLFSELMMVSGKEECEFNEVLGIG